MYKIINDIFKRWIHKRVINLIWGDIKLEQIALKKDKKSIKVKIKLINYKKWIHKIPVRIIN